MDRALASNAPTVVEAEVAPFTSPLPPQNRWDQALNFAKALDGGEDHPLRKTMRAMSHKVRELV